MILLIHALAIATVLPTSISLQLPENGAPSGLQIRSSLLPRATLELVTCETVLEGDHDYGVHAVAVRPEDWRIRGDKWAYDWEFPGSVLLRFEAQPEGDSLKLRYSLTNRSDRTLERVQIHPCLPTLGAAMFYPGTAEQSVPGQEGRGARIGNTNYVELWDRLYLWTEAGKFAFRESNLAALEKHLAFLRRGEAPVTWSWWRNAELPFDMPWIAVVSKDGGHVLGMAFEQSIWASSNVGDGRACFHLFPYVGKLLPGETKAVNGRLYILEGGADTASDRFRVDFPNH